MTAPSMPSLTELAARFPLVPRRRPPAGPIDARATRLAGLATAAHRDQDADRASTAFNGAALLASDCGAADLAAAWCRWHASLYLNRPHLDAHALRFALEPVVNLARLRTRAGDGTGAHQLLTDLHHAVTQRLATTIDGVDVHPDAWDTDTRQAEVNHWLRGVLLADGIRALVTAGRWTAAAEHARHHGGLTRQLYEGRQVAILAALIANDRAAAELLLLAAEPQQPWEHAIQTILLAICTDPAEITDQHRQTVLALATAPELAPGNGLAVYRTRLGVTAIDLAGPGLGLGDDGQQLIDRLCADALADQDGHAVKDLLGHPLVSAGCESNLQAFYQRSGLHSGELPPAVLGDLQQALRLAANTIQSSA